MGVPPDLVAFHVGIVVRDLHAVMDRYQRLFALEHWHLRDPQPGIPLRIAYGGRAGTGLAFELIEPVPARRASGASFWSSAAKASSTSASGHRTCSGRSRRRWPRAAPWYSARSSNAAAPSCRSRCRRASSRASWPTSTSAWARYASS